MMQKLRDKTSGWIVTVILGLLMIPFLFVIDSSYLGGVGAQNVAKVAAPPTWWSWRASSATWTRMPMCAPCTSWRWSAAPITRPPCAGPGRPVGASGGVTTPRRLTAVFVLFAAGSFTIVLLYTQMPVSNAVMLWLGFPLGFFASGIFSGMGAFLTELFPTRIRGSGQGFFYNIGKVIAYSSGTKVGRAQEAAAAGGLVRVIAY